MSCCNCCFLTCIQVSQEAGQVVWYSHVFQNFPQFIVIPTVKGFGIVNKAEIVFLPGESQGRGAWWAAVYVVAQSRARLKWLSRVAEMFFWNSFAFSMIQRMLAIWSLVPLPFLKAAWTSGSSQFTYCWSLAWRILSITLLACEMSAIVQ